MIDSDTRKHLFCVNCGAKLQDNANFCGACGCPIRLDLPSDNIKVCEEVSAEANTDNKPVSTAKGPFNLTIAEKRYTIRKNYTIRGDEVDVLYIAKSEGLPKMPEIVVYKKDKQVARLRKSFLRSHFGVTRNTYCTGGERNTLLSNGKGHLSVYMKFQKRDGDLSLAL